jgi:hypothetical protein
MRDRRRVWGEWVVRLWPAVRASREAGSRSYRVALAFYLGCLAWRRASNWLHRRFYRAKLPRPLETQKGVPRRAHRHGGRWPDSLNDSSNSFDPIQLLSWLPSTGASSLLTQNREEEPVLR